MDVPEIQMPSFSFSEAEKVGNDVHILSLLDQCATFLDQYRTSFSTLDLDDAYFASHEALMLAKDSYACESPPLAKCYLYKGHVLCAEEKFSEARCAYRKASKTSSHNPIDITAAKQAAPLAAQMEQKMREARRKAGIWSPHQEQSIPRDSIPAIEFLNKRYLPDSERKKLTSLCAFPSTYQVSQHKPVITKPQLENLPEPQTLVESDGVWTAEVQSTASHKEKIRNGLCSFIQEKLARNEDCSTIRIVN